jgi:hypothetical protein
MSGTPCGITSIFPREPHTLRAATGRQFAHDNQAIGELCDLFEHDPLICVRLAQNRVQRSDQRHFQSAQQGQNVAARGAAVDAVFMLQADKIVAIEVQEICGPLIGGNVFLRQLQAHLFRIIVAGIGIVDGNGKEASFSVFGCERGGECSVHRSVVNEKWQCRTRAADNFPVKNERNACGLIDLGLGPARVVQVHT